MARIRKTSASFNELEDIILKGIRIHRQGLLKKLWRLHGVAWHAIRSRSKRKKLLRTIGLLVPSVIEFSPTMHCNLSCAGCYSRDYPRNNELSLDEIDTLFSSAAQLGVFLFVITGGEPLLKKGLLDMFQKHRGLLFVMVTNGTLLDGTTAGHIARSRNIIPLVSLEGFQEQTDSRRGQGVHEQAIRAMELLRANEVIFGFSATVRRDNHPIVSSEPFIDDMITRGCTLGQYAEYIPLGSQARWDMVLQDEEQTQFRDRIAELRKNKSIILVHLPDDEYFEDGRCRAQVYGSVHITAQGYVEPCPFSHYASDTIREKSLEEALQSRFLAEIRASNAIVRRTNLGCALFENRGVVQKIAARTGARPSDTLQ